MRIRFIVLLLCLIPLSSYAKDEIFEVQEVQFLNPDNTDAELQQKIMFARKLISERNFSGASSFLEVLYESHPQNSIITNLLTQCYSQLKLYFKLEELLKREIQENPTNLGYYLSLAEVQAQQVKFDEALESYKQAIARIDGVNRVRYQLVIQSMLQYDFEQEAEKQILTWRKESGDSNLLGYEMGLILEKKKEYAKALAEFYPLLEDTTRIGNSVEREIVELLMFEDSRSVAEQFLVEKNDKEFNVRTVKILSLHYIRTGQLEKSFEYTKLRDSLLEKNGNSLISYMQTCHREKLYDETIKMGRYVLSQYDNPSIQNRARFIIADAYSENKLYDSAFATYNLIFEDSKAVRDKADALYYIGKIYQDKLFKFDTALTYFDSVATSYQTGLNYMHALEEIPYCYVQMGELEKAMSLYGELSMKRLEVNSQEKVLFQLAQTFFIDEKIDSSKTLISKLLISYPTGFYINDALSLMKIMQSGEDDQEALKLYAKALLFEIQHKQDSAIAELDKIAQKESQVLADFALFKITENLIQQKDSLLALEYIDKLETNFPESYYLPYALKEKADIILAQNKKTDEAYQIYRHLLKDFPNYPFISEVRKILRDDSEMQIDQTS